MLNFDGRSTKAEGRRKEGRKKAAIVLPGRSTTSEGSGTSAFQVKERPLLSRTIAINRTTSASGVLVHEGRSPEAEGRRLKSFEYKLLPSY
uniref:Uncharacterized protein n=1 Tax=Tolypothrix bouteillei VB521301 TaxID=1479485 RepID=A0A0C1R7D8_9CYAN